MSDGEEYEDDGEDGDEDDVFEDADLQDENENSDEESEGSEWSELSGEDADGDEELYALAEQVQHELDAAAAGEDVEPYPLSYDGIDFPTQPDNAPKHWEAWVNMRLPLPLSGSIPETYSERPGLTAAGIAILLEQLGMECWNDDARAAVRPEHLWMLFFTVAMLTTLVTETNNYAHYLMSKPRPTNIPASRPWPPAFLKKWKPVTMEELKVFIGLCYAFGISKCASINKFYSLKPRATFVRPPVCDMMARDRFKAIEVVYILRTTSSALKGAS